MGQALKHGWISWISQSHGVMVSVRVEGRERQALEISAICHAGCHSRPDNDYGDPQLWMPGSTKVPQQKRQK